MADIEEKSPLVQIPIPAATLAALMQLTSSLKIDQQAAAVVCDVLVHFGAGYGAEVQAHAGGSAPSFGNIFKTPNDIRAFCILLFESTIRRFPEFNWMTNSGLRDQVRRAAFKHGQQARQKVVADNSGTLNIAQILDTLATVKATDCPSGPGGAGGGPICDF